MDIDKIIEELTLLVLWLTCWNESKRDKQLKEFGPIYKVWKGYDLRILNKLKEKKLINFSYKSKSLYLTEKGVEEAKKLEKKYL